MIPTLQLLLCSVLVFSLGMYLLIAIVFTYGGRRMLRLDAPSEPGFRVDPAAPGVTILKPCCGHDDDLDGCLESYYRLNYPNFQLILGVRSKDDAAFPIICEVARRHPERRTDIVTEAGRSMNLKIANFETMLPLARHDLIMLSDSNTMTHPDMLASMVEELHQPGVAEVVAPVVGIGERSSGSFFDNLSINSSLWMGTLSIYVIMKRVAGLGKTVLLRRTDLDAVGLAAMGRSFGDDEVLVSGLTALGKKVVFGRRLVGSVSRDAAMRRSITRHLRWLQIRWTMAPLPSSIYESIMSPMIPVIVLLLAYPTMQHLAWFAEVTFFQIVVDVYAFSRMRGELPPVSRFLMLATRPVINFVLWFYAAIDRRVTWRGRTFWMGSGATILQAPPDGLGVVTPTEVQPVLPTHRD